MKVWKIAAILVAVVAVILAVLVWVWFSQVVFAPTESQLEVGVAKVDEEQANIEVVAESLQIPWEVAWAGDAMLVTERAGRLVRIDSEKTAIPIAGVQHVGEGGLLGLAVHPDFSRNQFIYLYLTTAAGEGLVNRVERYRLVGDNLSDRVVILEGIPGAQFHDGGRIEFGPDGLLYITTGDAGDPDNAQNVDSLAGKILRVKDDGSVPADNPFNSSVYSYGHRNPQGLAWDEAGRLWATEHGRSGVRSGLDEINLIEPGKNYGWPVIEGDERQAEMESPIVQSGPDDTWAPAGAAIVGKSLFFAGLRGEALYEAKLSGKNIAGVRRHLQSEFGRLRAVVLSPDEQLYITTSNTDGRGSAQAGDDKIIRIDPAVFSGSQ